MNKRKLLSIVSIASIVGSLLVFVGNGCGGQFQTSENASLNPSGGPDPGSLMSGADEDSDFVLGEKTASVIYSQQALDQLAACLGVEVPSDPTLRMYDSKRGQISVYGTAETITSPMMMGVISTAGELCNDLINQENASGLRIFKGWNLSSNNVPATGDVNDAITRLALSCWQRPETATERDMVLDAVTSVSNGDPMASKQSALILCTSMLASLNSLLN
jgi:hypothetical protein